jgi:Icc protein
MNQAMASKDVTRVAHISDVHILEPRRRSQRVGFGSYDLSTTIVSIGRPLDADERVRKLRRAIATATRSGAQHLVVSGDLTELGSPSQFEAFAEALHDSHVDPSQVTLVPGNHDAYTSGDAWARALDGPLRAFRESSAEKAGKLVDRGSLIFMPIDVTCHQAITRSAGEISEDATRAIEHRIIDPALKNKAIVLVQHHPPFSHKRRAVQWIDGLRGWGRLMDLLTRHSRVQILHGHLHHVVDRIIGIGKSRIFGASATVDDGENARVRIYDMTPDGLESAGIWT